MINDKGLMVIISGPSGAGKGTVVKALLDVNEKIKLSISATTREPRENEQHGQHYFFLEKSTFEDLIEKDGVLEYAKYCDNYYGTPKQYVLDNMEAGNDVILEIEIQGRNQVVKKYPKAISIFVVTKNFKVLEDRLVGRGTEDEKTIEKRLNRAKEEMEIASSYDYIVVNDELQDCVNDILSIISAEKNKSTNRENFIKEVFYNV